MSSGEIAPQLTTMNGRSRRAEASWIPRATSSLPLPVSPSIRTGTSDAATRRIVATSFRTWAEPPIRPNGASTPTVDAPARFGARTGSASAESARADAVPGGTVGSSPAEVPDTGWWKWIRNGPTRNITPSSRASWVIRLPSACVPLRLRRSARKYCRPTRKTLAWSRDTDGSGSWRSASRPLPILTSFWPSRTSTVIPFEMDTESLPPDRPGSSPPPTRFSCS